MNNLVVAPSKPMLTLSVEAFPENSQIDDLSGKSKRMIVDVLDGLLDYSLRRMVLVINQKSQLGRKDHYVLSLEEIQPVFRRNYKMNGRFIEVEIQADVSRLPKRYTQNIAIINEKAAEKNMKNPILSMAFHAVCFFFGLNKDQKAEALKEAQEKFKTQQWQDFSQHFSSLLLGGAEEVLQEVFQEPDVIEVQQQWKSFQMRRRP